MALCIRAFARHDRAGVAAETGKAVERLGERSALVHKRALGRLGDLDVFWQAGGASLKALCRGVVNAIAIPPGAWDALDPDDQGILSLVAVDDVRNQFPRLEETFEQLASPQKAQVISRRPATYFVSHLAQLLRGATGWRMAEQITYDAVLPCARWMDQAQLDGILTGWAENDQARTASAMPSLAVDLYRATEHLHPWDSEVWTVFVDQVRATAPTSYYQYSEVAALLAG